MKHSNRCFYKIVAKTNRNAPDEYLPLWMHARDTAAVTQYLMDHWLAESVVRVTGLNRKELCKLTTFLSMIHDVGKATNSFQMQIRECFPQVEEMAAPLTLREPDSSGDAYRHHTLTGAAILNELGVRDYIVSIVGAHHGKTMDKPDFRAITGAEGNFYGKTADKPLWRSLWKEYLEEAMEQAGYASLEEIPGEMSKPAQILLAALLIVSDWIASSTTFFPLIDEEHIPDESAYPGRAKRAMEKMEFSGKWTPNDSWQYEDLYKERFDYDANAVQQAVAQIAGEAEQPGLFILEAPMGVGKTEAALVAREILAERMRESGLAFFLPSQATANAMFERIVAWIQHFLKEAQSWDEDAACGEGSLSITLSHGKAKLNETFMQLVQGNFPSLDDGAEGLATNAFFMGRKTQLLANFVVGTVDQLLLAALRQKHLMLRHLGLAGKTVIVDEVHAYDAYMTCYMTRMLDWLAAYRTPVILLSATLPGKRRAELVGAYLGEENFPGREALEKESAYPLLTWTDGQTMHTKRIAMEKKVTDVRILRGGDEAVIPFLRQRLQSGGCAAVIVNTVRRAQQLTEELAKAFPAPQYTVLLDHAQFVMPDRIRQEKEIMARMGKRSTPEQRSGLIVVGSQVLEQSLDYDADVMITDLCPMDLLFQRLGRLHRHRDRLRPEPVRQATCLVLGTDMLEEGAKAIYGEYLLTKTAALLPETLRLPDDISPLVQRAYSADCEKISEKRAEIEKLLEKYNKHTTNQARRANGNCISKAQRKQGSSKSARLIDGLTNREIDCNEAQERAAVRDGDASFEVLLLQYGEDGLLHTVRPQEEPLSVGPSAMPSMEEAQIILRQSLRLPHRFSMPRLEKMVIDELEGLRGGTLQEWTKSPVIGRELFLLLDREGETMLAGTRLRYDGMYGLRMEQEDEDGGEGV